MRAEIGHLPAGVIPEPAEMVERAVWVVSPPRRRAEPHFVIQIGRRILIRRIAKARRDVAEKVALHGNELPQPSAANELARPLIMRAGALLRSHLHDGFVAARRVHHPAALANE